MVRVLNMKLGFAAALVAMMILCAQVAAAQQWVEVKSTAHKFAALFPQQPTESARSDNVKQSFFLLDLGTRTFLISVVDLPRAPTPDAAYWTTRVNDYAKGSNTKVKSSQPRKLAGHPGFEAVTFDESGNQYHLIDMFIVGTKLYLLVSVGPKGHETGADASRFRDSFRLLK